MVMEALTRNKLRHEMQFLHNVVIRAKVKIGRKLVSQIKKLSKKKTANNLESEKNVRKIQRLTDELHTLNNLKPNSIGIFLLSNTAESAEKLRNQPNVESRIKILSKMSLHNNLKPLVEEFHQRYPQWKEELPKLAGKEHGKIQQTNSKRKISKGGGENSEVSINNDNIIRKDSKKRIKAHDESTMPTKKVKNSLEQNTKSTSVKISSSCATSKKNILKNNSLDSFSPKKSKLLNIKSKIPKMCATRWKEETVSEEEMDAVHDVGNNGNDIIDNDSSDDTVDNEKSDDDVNASDNSDDSDDNENDNNNVIANDNSDAVDYENSEDDDVDNNNSDDAVDNENSDDDDVDNDNSDDAVDSENSDDDDDDDDAIVSDNPQDADTNELSDNNLIADDNSNDSVDNENSDEDVIDNDSDDAVDSDKSDDAVNIENNEKGTMHLKVNAHCNQFSTNSKTACRDRISTQKSLPKSEQQEDPFFLTADNKKYMTFGKIIQEPNEIFPVRDPKSFNTRNIEQINSKESSRFRYDGNKFERNNRFRYDGNKFERGNRFGYDGNKFESSESNCTVLRESIKLHPSWEAKKKGSNLLPFEGKKIVFDG